MREEFENKLRSSATCHSPIGVWVTYGERVLFFQVNTEEEHGTVCVQSGNHHLIFVSAARRPRIMLTTDLILWWATNNLTGRLKKWSSCRRLLEQSRLRVVFVNETEKLIHKIFLSLFSYYDERSDDAEEIVDHLAAGVG